MIRIVNLMIGLSSTMNLRRRRRTLYEPDAPSPVYILEKNQNVNRMGGILFTFANENVNWMAPHPVYNFFPKCKPDGVPSGSHFHLKIWIG